MIYLDNAATTFPKPPQVLRASAGVMQKLGANPGRSGHRMSLAAGRIVMRCREELADLLAVDAPEEIIFCFNCTDALNLALRGLPLRGGHVIATALDHNASLRPLSGMAARGEIALDILPPGPDGVVTASQVEQALQPDTRLVALSHASNGTGAVQPAEEIGSLCRARGVTFLLDAAQTLGVLPVHPLALNADLMAFPGHKGLLGPMGTGGLWIRPGITLAPYREGGTGSRSESPLQPEEMPDRYESGTMNLPGIAGLLAGVRFVRAHADEIQQKEAALQKKAAKRTFAAGRDDALPPCGPLRRDRFLQRGKPPLGRGGGRTGPLWRRRARRVALRAADAPGAWHAGNGRGARQPRFF